ncbi:CarD family transcriptional regulator [Desulfitobacterium sp. LBE]|uniref:CarD-like/TRCF RNAP-interacting domain-containing protein n=5 Tax=root TaxID=1 RepID=Q250R2_DESHY|nr:MULTISPECIES: CarD family transcriptional regulator [Desulfitobacterium]ACL18459.1 transcriptional regulator, CarD family [Desulfitobacterium hafniense DCB-2]EHL07925.1 CarD-like protein [Desulfitobacterium hafniense DP7]KTE92868.1 CarD family transcriptional regulator [Desulfitobacterium hafniense]MEA5023737.1 CarD family transcriptional regulator [Desulfitobacterium hafniense]TWH58615.1 CarD family transcriptional regulator [Desulfitobacterium sp. LBE]
MFDIGDRVVYPMHGAGIIEAIEEREVLGESHQYYVMNIPVGNMKVYIPLKNVNQLGIRGVISSEEVPQVLKILENESTLPALAWNRRYRANMDRIKSGDIYSVAEVVRSLSQRDREKGLSTGEKKMYDNAYQILVSELILAEGVQADEMSERIKGLLA